MAGDAVARYTPRSSCDVALPSGAEVPTFQTLEATIRYAKKITFATLERHRYTDMPDQMDWRVYQDDSLFPCPVCQQPMYRKAKLGPYGTSLDLRDWGCARCKKTVTLNTDGLLSTATVAPAVFRAKETATIACDLSRPRDAS